MREGAASARPGPRSWNASTQHTTAEQGSTTRQQTRAAQGFHGMPEPTNVFSRGSTLGVAARSTKV